jgi:hypothetical protein
MERRSPINTVGKIQEAITAPGAKKRRPFDKAQDKYVYAASTLITCQGALA